MRNSVRLCRGLYGIGKGLIGLLLFGAATFASGQNVTIYGFSVPEDVGYDGVSNLLTCTDTANDAWSNMQYDNLNRLTSATATSGVYGGLTFAVGLRFFREPQEPDSLGLQRLAPTATSATRRPDGNNNSSYDAAGNLMFDGTNTMLYDVEKPWRNLGQ